MRGEMLSMIGEERLPGCGGGGLRVQRVRSRQPRAARQGDTSRQPVALDPVGCCRPQRSRVVAIDEQSGCCVDLAFAHASRGGLDIGDERIAKSCRQSQDARAR